MFLYSFMLIIAVACYGSASVLTIGMMLVKLFNPLYNEHSMIIAAKINEIIIIIASIAAIIALLLYATETPIL